MVNLTSIDSTEEWKEVTKSIHYYGPEIRADGIYYDIVYKGHFIGRVRYDGKIEWLFHKSWQKKNLNFKVTYTGGFITFWKKK